MTEATILEGNNGIEFKRCEKDGKVFYEANSGEEYEYISGDTVTLIGTNGVEWTLKDNILTANSGDSGVVAENESGKAVISLSNGFIYKEV